MTIKDNSGPSRRDVPGGAAVGLAVLRRRPLLPLGRPAPPAELGPIHVAPAVSYSTGQIFGATGGRSEP